MATINISNLLKQTEECLGFSEDLANFTVDEFEITCVHADGEVVNNNGRLEFYADIAALAKAPCSRCLSEVFLPLAVSVSENLSENLDNLDAIHYNGYDVDLSAIAEEILTLELPMVVHCGNCNGGVENGST